MVVFGAACLPLTFPCPGRTQHDVGLRRAGTGGAVVPDGDRWFLGGRVHLGLHLPAVFSDGLRDGRGCVAGLRGESPATARLCGVSTECL